MPEAMSDTTESATAPDTHAPHARDAADKIRAALIVLEAVQDFRYAGEHAALREAMRQAAIAALESACSDAVDAWQAHC